MNSMVNLIGGMQDSVQFENDREQPDSKEGETG